MINPEEKVSSLNRRLFLTHVLKMSGQVAFATAGIYSVSLISSNEKFGGMTAGAKTWQYVGNISPCVDYGPASEGAACSSPGAIRRGAKLGTGSLFCRELQCLS